MIRFDNGLLEAQRYLREEMAVGQSAAKDGVLVRRLQKLGGFTMLTPPKWVCNYLTCLRPCRLRHDIQCKLLGCASSLVTRTRWPIDRPFRSCICETRKIPALALSRLFTHRTHLLWDRSTVGIQS